ncbi:hypothetical protein ACHAWF_005393 [Thalassiosira exigua]
MTMTMNSLVPSFVLLVLLATATTTTVLVLHSSIHSLRITYQTDIAQVNDRLRTVQSQQATYAQHVQTLTKLVSSSLNATDEYIHNITNQVSETQDVIQDNMDTVQDMQKSQNSLMAVQFAGMFTILVILVSGYHLSQHMRHMHSPVVQRKIMAVLWMTPIYSLSSWMSLVFEAAEPYLSVIREFYEAYCVYMFLSFLIAVLGRGDRQAVVDLLEARADKLARPDKCRCGPKFWKRCWKGCCERFRGRGRAASAALTQDLSLAESVAGEAVSNENANSPRLGADSNIPNVPNLEGRAVDEMGNFVSPARVKAEATLDQCQMYAMQFVLLRPVTAIGWLVSNQLVTPTQFLDPKSPQMYITIVTNASIFFAFRGLVRFYHATRSNLAWCNPWPKFLCIKGVVFMTFWQRMVLSLIVNLGYADKFDTHEDADAFVRQSQNFLICLEMLFSAVAHCFVFSPDEWAEGYREREEERRRNMESRAFGDSVALGDFIHDVKIVMASKKKRRKKRREGLSPSSTGDDDEASALDSTHLSSGGDSEEGDSSYQRASSIEMKGGGDPPDNLFSIDEGENGMELATPSPPKHRHRRRLDTGGSVDSDGGEIGGSLRRIEQFINEHTPRPDSDDEKELV